MTTEKLEFVFEARTAEEMARKLRQTANELHNVGQTADKAGKAAAQGFGKMSGAAAAGGQALQTLGSSSGVAAQKIGDLGQKAASIGVAFATGGPWAAAFAGAAAAVTLLGEAFAVSSERATRMFNAMARGIPTLDALVARTRQMEERASRQRRLDSGGASSGDLRDAAVELGAEIGIARTNAQRSRGRSRERIEAEIADMERRFADLQERQRAASENEQAQAVRRAEISEANKRRRRGGRGGGGGSDPVMGGRNKFALRDEMREAEAVAAEKRKREREEADERRQSIQDQADDAASPEAIGRINDAVAALQDRIQTAAIDASNTFRDSWRGSIEDVVKAFEEYNRVAAETGRASRTTGDLVAKSAKQAGGAVVENIGENATAALRSNVDAWLSGELSIGAAVTGILKEVVKAIAIESTIKAIFQTGEGIAALASYRFDAAAGHFAAAGVYAGVAVAAGAVGVATGAVGGGGSGAGAGTGGGRAGGQPARPERSSGGGEQQSGGTTVINLYALEPSAEVGRRVVRSIDAAKRMGYAA